MKRKNKIILASLVLVSVGMIVGFSILSKQLKIEGTATIDSNYDVAITGIYTIGGLSTDKDLTQDDSSIVKSVQKSEPTYTSDTATFNVTLNDTDMYYNVTVQNNGSVGAIIDNITINSTSEAVVASLVGDVEGVYIAPGEYVGITVSIGRDKSVDFTGSATVTVTVNTKQYTSEEKKYPDPVLAFHDDAGGNNLILTVLASEINGKISDSWTLYVSVDGGEYNEVATHNSPMEYEYIEFSPQPGHLYKLKAVVTLPNGTEKESNIITLQT